MINELKNFAPYLPSTQIIGEGNCKIYIIKEWKSFLIIIKDEAGNIGCVDVLGGKS